MHQMPFLEALRQTVDSEVICVHAEDVPADRIALGWSIPSAVGVKVMQPREAESSRLLAADGGDTFHLFSGIHCHPFVSAMFRKAMQLRLATGVISEAHDGRGIRGFARRMRSRIDAIRYASRIQVILAMGSLGVDWYRTAGFRPETIFPFAYVGSPQVLSPQAATTGDRPFSLAFVGQLIPRKGIDLLFRALATLGELPWRLEIAGTGPLEPMLRDMATAEGISDRITWHGSLPNQAVGAMLASCDLLVLPSRFDGWGVVVNEALSAGTPVVCSDACGAADLLATPQLGRTFRAASVQSLGLVIRQQLAQGRPTGTTRELIRDRAAACSPGSVAGYFVKITQAVRTHTDPPPPPWRFAV
ncbi:MAG: glycosyltransferase [Planctomycetia bacterium]